MQKILLAVGLIVLVANLFVLSPGCANIVPPMGGLRDSLPPVLMNVTPPDSTMNFAGKRITFTFNEFLQLDNIQQNLIVSPTLKITPQVEAKLRTITVQIRDTLEENTTYSFNFGNSIRDINEGNILRNFTYIFSTGNYLDSLEFSGKVILAETGAIDTTLTIMLHTDFDDSAVINKAPRYITRLDGEGNFRFMNLPAGTFAVYALEDENGSRRYFSKNQLFAYSDSQVVISQNTPSITMFAYIEGEEKPAVSPSTISAPAAPKPGTPPDQRLRFAPNLRDGQLDLLDSLHFNFLAAPLRSFDSTLTFFANEAFEPIADHYWIRDTSNRRVTLMHNWKENTAYNLILKKDFAEDTAGRKLLRDDTLSFRTRKTSEYGLIKMRFLNLNLAKNPILLLVQNSEVKYTHIFTGREFNKTLFPPGEYEMRIVYDENQNGKWDPGRFFGEKRQPEKILTIGRKLNVKPNWDNEIDIELE